MSFRKIPFQFSSTDPVERQLELEKRFGLPSTSDMYVDVANPLTMGAGCKLNENIGSPRLQHRVPIFIDGGEKSAKSSVDSIGNVDTNKKSNVRIIPIEIEGEEYGPHTRQRTFSGPAGWLKGKEPASSKDSSSLKRSMQDLSHSSKVKSATGPKVHNIPVQIEGRSNAFKNIKSEKLVKESDTPKVNGCTSSNLTIGKAPMKQQIDPEKLKLKSSTKASLKKVENVLEEFKSYESEVKKFVGSIKDKKYRYLDEMLTRCMLRLDDVDTMGDEEVRSSRKSAIKQVQACIDLLESKVNAFIERDDKMEVQNDVCVDGQTSQDLISEVEMAETEGKCELKKGKIDESTEVQNEIKIILETEENVNAAEIVPERNPATCSEIEMIEASEVFNETDNKMEIQDGFCANVVNEIKVDASKDLIPEVGMTETEGKCGLVKDKIDESTKMQDETGEVLVMGKETNMKEINNAISKSCEKPVYYTEIDMTETKENLADDDSAHNIVNKEVGKYAEMNNLIEPSKKMIEVDTSNSVLCTIALKDEVNGADMENQSLQRNGSYADQTMSGNVETDLKEPSTNIEVIGDFEASILEKTKVVDNTELENGVLSESENNAEL